MSFSMPIQWYHTHADPIWPDGTFKSDFYIAKRIGGSLIKEGLCNNRGKGW
jgi:hypothetical protein